MSFREDSNVPYQVDNPTNEDRHRYLKYLLDINKRSEDFENIIEALSPPRDITTVCPKGKGRGVRVAVIGGGEAGLSAAFELRKIGCSVTIFEAASRLGGRVHTHYFDNYGRYFGDLGAMRIPSSHETTWHYINLFKLPTSPFAVRNINGLFYLRNARAVNDPEGMSIMRNIYPKYRLTDEESKTPWHKLASRVTEHFLKPLPPDIRRELIDVKQNYSNEIKIIDSLNYRQAYSAVRLSDDAIAMLGYLSTFEQTFFRLSLTEILQEAYTVDFAYTYRINGGMENIIHAFYKALCSRSPDAYGVSAEELGPVFFRMRCPVDGIYNSPEGKGIILEYREEPYFMPLYEKFDYVVCAIPFSSLRRVKIKPLFPVQKVQAINELNYEVSHKTFLFLKYRFWEMGDERTRIVGGSSSTDLPIITLFYPSDHALPLRGVLNGWTLKPGASPWEPGVMLASYNWPMDSVRLGEAYDKLRIYDIIGYVERLHGLPRGFMDNILLDYKSITWSDVQYEWSAACLTKPEDKISFSFVATQPEMGNRIFFAGEHISQKHAWQQGALQTGMIAANGIAENIKPL